MSNPAKKIDVGSVSSLKGLASRAKNNRSNVSVEVKTNKNTRDALITNDPSKVPSNSSLKQLDTDAKEVYGEGGALASLTGKKDPFENPGFRKDLDDIVKNKDKANPKTPEGIALKKKLDKMDKKDREVIEDTSKKWETIQSLGKWGGGFAAFFAILQLLAKANTGCYIVKKDGTQIKSCKQEECSIGGTCGDASGNPTGGRCCSGGGMTSAGDMCSCIEKSMLDVAEDLADGVARTAQALANAASTGLDLLPTLLEYWPYIAIAFAFVMFGLPLLKTLFSVVSAVTPKGSDSGGTQKIIVTTQPTPQPFIDCSSGWAKYRPECAGKS